MKGSIIYGPHGLSKSDIIKEVAKKKGWKIKIFKAPPLRGEIARILKKD
jgi:hypothetical protein